MREQTSDANEAVGGDGGGHSAEATVDATGDGEAESTRALGDANAEQAALCVGCYELTNISILHGICINSL